MPRRRASSSAGRQPLPPCLPLLPPPAPLLPLAPGRPAPAPPAPAPGLAHARELSGRRRRAQRREGGGAGRGGEGRSGRGRARAGAALLRKQPREGILGAGPAPSRARGAGPRAARVTGRLRPAAAGARLPRVGGRPRRRGRAGLGKRREILPRAAASPHPQPPEAPGLPPLSVPDLEARVAELHASPDVGNGMELGERRSPFLNPQPPELQGCKKEAE